MPCRDAAEIALKRLREFGGRLLPPGRRIVPMSAERIEIDLVQGHGAGSRQLFALETVDLERRCTCQVEARKMCFDSVQSSNGAAVIVYVMAHKEPFRK